jgi:TonB family protein
VDVKSHAASSLVDLRLMASTIGNIKGLSKGLSCLKDNGQFFVAVVAIATNFFWLGCLLRNQDAFNYSPWLLALIAATFACAAAVLPAQSSRSFNFVRIRQNDGFALGDWLSITYSAFSLMAALLFFHERGYESRTIASQQFIDIQLTSFADFHNNNDLLPGTEPKPSLRKRRGSLDKPTTAPHLQSSAQSPLSLNRPATRLSQAANPTSALKRSAFKGRERPAIAEPMFIISEQPQERETVRHQAVPTSLSLPLKAARIARAGERTRQASPEPLQIEEVEPAKLLEVTDNDGDAGSEVWQAGGRSSGGKGARSQLANYLRELHKRLKRAWSPPLGTASGKTEILFRLSKDGELCSIRLAAASTDPAIDQSAIKAISNCAPFGRLPSDYSLDYLDLRYTFNYTADELKEADNLSISETY